MTLGLTMTYAITKIPNFAHAEYVTVGASAALSCQHSLGVLKLLSHPGIRIAFEDEDRYRVPGAIRSHP